MGEMSRFKPDYKRCMDVLGRGCSIAQAGLQLPTILPSQLAQASVRITGMSHHNLLLPFKNMQRFSKSKVSFLEKVTKQWSDRPPTSTPEPVLSPRLPPPVQAPVMQ